MVLVFFKKIPDAETITKHIIFNALSLWEPLFVFGWLLLCFDRAFGAIPAIIITAICFAGYHIGSLPTNAMIGVAISSVILGILFRITKNILVLWPIGWCFSASIGTLKGGISFKTSDIITYAIILAIQIIFIYWCLKKKTLSTKPLL